MQSFCSKIYVDVCEIIGWDPNKGKKNVDSGTLVTEDASDVGTGGWSISGGGR